MNTNAPMPPLWIEHPDIPWSSIGWRMGWGEAYWSQWKQFFLTLDESDRSRYREAWPEPEPWKGLYAFIESGEIPPWAVEHKRRLAGPYPVPGADETGIGEYYRVVWLIRRYMTPLPESEVFARFSSASLKARNEDHIGFYAEPSGAWWRLATLKSEGWSLRRLTHADAPHTLLKPHA